CISRGGASAWRFRHRRRGRARREQERHPARRRRHGGAAGGRSHQGQWRRASEHRATGVGARKLRRYPCFGPHAARSVAPDRTGGRGGGGSMRRVNKDERAKLSLTLNGRKVTGEAEPRMLLSDFLRHVLGATGTHVGCEHGVCGCCTVLIDGTAV